MQAGDKKEKCECKEGSCKCCCEPCHEMPEFLKCDKTRCVFMQTILKQEAKRYCCMRRELKGIGMGMGIWLPCHCSKEELEKCCHCCCCCDKECKDKDSKDKECKGKECSGEEDCLTKNLRECHFVPEYIKSNPMLLCMFRMEVVKQYAKQCMRAACMQKCCAAGMCCCKDKCCDKGKECHKEECRK